MASTKTRTVGTTNFIGGSLREDLTNMITQLSPESTPFLSTLGSTKAKQPRHDWQTDVLAAPVANAQSEDFSFDTSNASDDTPTRLSNYTQVFGKTIHVAGSLIKSDFAGAQDYFSYQRMKRGKEIMRDIERKHLLWHNVTGASGANTQEVVYNNSSASRTMGGVMAYASNYVRASSTTVAAYNSAGTATALTTTSGVGFNTRETDGTKAVAYTAAPAAASISTDSNGSDWINALAQTFADNNGMWKVAQVPTGLKAAVSSAMISGNGGAAQRRADEMAKKVNLAVDAIVTEFGFDVSVVPNYIMQSHADDANSVILAYDPSAMKRAVLTPMMTEEDGTARYGKGYIQYCDESLEVTDPNSVGAIVGASA